MEDRKIHESEYRLCLILWDREPITAVELAKLALQELGWKRTTTYTVIKRLCDRGILRNDGGTVTALVSREEAQAMEMGDLLEKKFQNSVPAFLTAFTRHQKLSKRDLDQIQAMIDQMREEDQP